MKRDKYINVFKKEDGAGLVLALMVLMVLAVLGVAVAGVTIGSHKLGDISRDSNSAYYIAEAGANLAYEEMKNGVMPAYETSSNDETIYFNNIAGMIADFNPTVYAEEIFETQFGDQPRATVTISDPKEKDDGKLYTITSIGEVDGKSRKVEKEFLVKFVPTTTGEGGGNFPEIPLNTALLVKDYINLQGGRIVGDVFLDTQTKESLAFNWGASVGGTVYTSYAGSNPMDIIKIPDWSEHSAFHNDVKHQNLANSWSDFDAMLNLIKKPNDLTGYQEETEIEFSSKDDIHINGDIYVLKIAGGGQYLTIDNRERDINIVVDDFQVKDWREVILLGDGQVNIFVQDMFSLTGSSKINPTGNTSCLRVYYFGETELSLTGGGVVLNGNLLIDQSDFTLSGSAKIKGALISGGQKAEVKGGNSTAAVILLPNGEVKVTGSGQVEGIVVSKKFFMSSSDAKVIWKPFDPRLIFPEYDGTGDYGSEGGSGSSTAPTLDNLISAGPALEP